MSIPSFAMADQCGITYRVLNYWTKQGYLHPEPSADGRSGTGIHQSWPDSEIPICRNMGRLVAEGLTVARSAAIARYGDPGKVLEVLGSQPESGASGAVAD